MLIVIEKCKFFLKKNVNSDATILIRSWLFQTSPLFPNFRHAL
jgi:hypothetical protein